MCNHRAQPHDRMPGVSGDQRIPTTLVPLKERLVFQIIVELHGKQTATAITQHHRDAVGAEFGTVFGGMGLRHERHGHRVRIFARAHRQ